VDTVTHSAVGDDLRLQSGKCYWQRRLRRMAGKLVEWELPLRNKRYLKCLGAGVISRYSTVPRNSKPSAL
jgi:hypothetical protein